MKKKVILFFGGLSRGRGGRLKEAFGSYVGSFGGKLEGIKGELGVIYLEKKGEFFSWLEELKRERKLKGREIYWEWQY